MSADRLWTPEFLTGADLIEVEPKTLYAVVEDTNYQLELVVERVGPKPLDAASVPEMIGAEKVALDSYRFGALRADVTLNAEYDHLINRIRFAVRYKNERLKPKALQYYLGDLVKIESVPDPMLTATYTAPRSKLEQLMVRDLGLVISAGTWSRPPAL